MTINRKYLKISLVIIFLFGMFITHAQTKTQWAIWKGMGVPDETDTSFYKKDFKEKYYACNLSRIWTETENLYVLGFIGGNYQRLQIKFISAVKDSINPDTYFVIGKSMVKNNICKFHGKLMITNIRCYKYFEKKDTENWGKTTVKNRGVLFGTYYFQEDSAQMSSGVFKGLFVSCWYINGQGKLKYDNLAGVDDSYCNNQFAGTWQGYHSNTKETCNWGDYRIPFSGDLDVGAGDFAPNDKYLIYGWKSYNSGFETDEELNKAVKDAEKWWKT